MVMFVVCGCCVSVMTVGQCQGQGVLALEATSLSLPGSCNEIQSANEGGRAGRREGGR